MLGATSLAYAQDGVDTGDTAWVLTSSALVFIMTPGLALFYGGMVRRKNFLSVLMQCFMIISIVTIQWVILGYSLAFGPDIKGWLGNLDWAFLRNVGMEPGVYSATIPHQAFMIFQLMFAIITPALIVGAFAERIKFFGFCIFSLLWATLVYDPIAHWVWAKGGFIGAMGGLDFAGGTVVHLNAGAAALAGALVLGKRRGYPESISPPHHLPLSVLGAALLWFGWFGFNAGSALGAAGLAANAFTTTHVATATAAFTWAVLDWVFNKRPTVLGMITGAVAGLVAITPAAGFVNPCGALGVGAGAGVFCYWGVVWLKVKLGYDDSLDVFGVHGIGGAWGALATGLWADASVNGANGLFYGNPAQVLVQLKAIAVTGVFSFVVSFILFQVVGAIFGLRASEEEEKIGLDITQHRESAYTILH